MDSDNTRLPLTIDEITPAWLTSALGERYPGTQVNDIEIVEVILGTSTKIRLRAEYARPLGPGRPSSTLCVKGGFDERARSFNTTALHLLEANFFRDLASTLNVRLPPCVYAGTDAEQGIVIFEDLTVSGVQFCDPTEPWSPATLGVALDDLAAMHAQTWGMTPGQHPWLQYGAPQVRDILLGLCADDAYWDGVVERFGAIVPADQLDRDRMLRAFTRLWQLNQRGTSCLVHWDPHIGNAYIDRNGQPGLVDWQCVCLAPYMHDVAYIIGGALTVDDRRAHEESLISHYLQALADHGGPNIPLQAAWLDYRRYSLYGWMWTLTSPLMQATEISTAMIQRHTTAIQDHRTLGLLEA
jgi:aminoglycoside/choline kinase family phosphotransferase